MKSLFYLWILFGLIAVARAQDIQFRKLTSNQGLSHNTVYGICQDDKGQMWFATREGLDRYDSYQIKNYYIKDSLPGISPDKIGALLCDHDSIYIATEDGLYIYNQQSDQISRSRALKQKLSVLCLLKAGKVLFVGGTTGLFKLEAGKSEAITQPNLTVRAMEQLGPDRFLISIGNQIRVIDGQGKTIKMFDGQSFTPLSIPNFDVYNMYKDQAGFVWLCTNYGLYYYDINQQSFIRLHFSARDTREISTVRAIASDGKDLLYIGTENGLYIYHRSTGQAENYGQSFDNNAKKLNDKAIYSAFIARDGSVWLGTYFGGINYIPSNTYAFERIMPQDNGGGVSGKAVSQMMEDSSHQIWIGTEDGGITIYDPLKDQYSYINKTSRPFYLGINNVHAIHSDGMGDIWVGTFLGGLHRFDLKNKTTTIYTNKPGDSTSLSSDNVYAVYRDSRGTLWIGTQNGVNIFDYPKGRFKHFRSDVFSYKFIYDIGEDQNGDIWFCTRFDGIYRYNPMGGTLNHYGATGPHPVLTSNQIISFYKDSKSNLWFGTLGGGILRFDFQKDTFKSYTTAEGLPNNNVYGILEDGAGYVWLTTNRGLSKYSPETDRFINYNNKYGLPSNQFNFKSYLKTKDGTLYFGSINGLLFFHPEKIAARHPLVPLIFTDFQLFNKTVVPAEGAVLHRQIDYTRNIYLNYNQNVFTINYAAIDYANPGSTHYAYYLKGFEDKWNYVDGKNSVTYTNLSPGSYTFYVVALSADGALQSVQRSIDIIVRPPFYRTKLAYLGYFLLLLLLIWLYTRFIRFLHQKKMEVLIERIEKEKTKELTQNRLNFFTFISHEFKTPLTLILASIEKLISEKGDALKNNKELAGIKNSASVLFKLIQQLMEFRKVETGHNSVQLSRADIVGFLREATAYFDTMAISKGIDLQFSASCPELFAYFDKDKLEKILFNILSNAIKNTQKGKITLRVDCLSGRTETEDLEPASTQITTKRDAAIAISVIDTGQGMTRSELKNIFNPFYKAPDSELGSGIGLSLVHSLVQYLNGVIAIESEVQKGTTISIKLPVVLKLEEKQPKKDMAPHKEGPSRADNNKLSLPEKRLTPENPAAIITEAKRYTLLIVEDNKELMVFLSNHFANFYHVISALNGQSALRKIAKLPPDIIISDVKMPKMDGIELCRHIKNNPKLSYLPVILLSEWESDEKRVTGLNTGADAYLGKPFNLKELELLVSNMIKSRVKLREHVISISELAIDHLPTNNKNQEFLTNLSNLLEKRFQDSDFTIENMARDLNMSRTSLHLHLKKSMGKSASELLNEYRLKRAAVMLENDMPINEAAYACGYNDPNYFSRVFKKYYGQTPAKYREQAKAEK
ncbi:Signal transduction histidine kinase [Arachidicoccus rhizosphaerae]|jgi:signal transduction histidine kinase/ligand-binding sensor domain-containing protein/DNA-binding response OmpR family regulator|uniref:histidine kinase n=1 Tax=Arachidicoccus rhizosphaerae TaxID=551991 RepID=A0A1H3Y1E3_9BACT|nr:two-component regulator propeller domain-containing protein [Arachidicoccus rhizosphaerae]SEA05555.1 Signal transduction histidine kinase [Arachidicoccus rhizosphaerae]